MHRPGRLCRSGGPDESDRYKPRVNCLEKETRMDSFQVYDNPLVTRYASPEMARLWGPQRKFSTWRRLWVALAEAEHELGMTGEDGVTPRITPPQIAELRAHVD